MGINVSINLKIIQSIVKSVVNSDKCKRQNAKGIILFLLSFILFIQLPCYSAKCKKPVINPCEKIDYVNINWWDNFSDPCLKEYIIQAINNNHDARKASWQVEEYRQNVKIQFAHELPSLSVGGTYILDHMPDEITTVKRNIFAVPFIASYEADVFLKNHDKTKSSKKTYEASKFQEKSIYISLASDVATTYINLIKYDKQICIQQDLVKVKLEELNRQKSRYKRGVTNIPTLNDYEKNYTSAKSTLDDLIKSRDKALNQLAVLIGETPENAACLKRNSWDNFIYLNQIPCGICSDVIFARPDVMAAEENLEKANIDVRVARKEFLPRFNIVGLYALSNFGAAGFGSWGSTIAALFAGATLDLFKGGQKVANLRLNKAKYEEMFENYGQVSLTALREVNDSLLIIREDSKINANAFNNLKVQEENYRRSQNSFKYGTISCPDLLVQQEALLNMVQNEINSRANYLIDYITLYKAVGGKL